MSRIKIVAAALVLAVSASPSVLAQGKRKGQANASVGLTLSMVTDQNGNLLPNWGDQVTFEVSGPDAANAHVQLVCSQNGSVVYGGLWPITPVLTLRSEAWQGGAADCSATAYYIEGSKKITIGSINFNVGE